MIKKKIDLLNCVISGEILIEASAGTGKTLSIVIFYLRLLLNIGINKKYSKILSVQEILVLTFTNQAKEELLIRVKKSITNLKNDCILKTSTNKIFYQLINKIQNLKKAIQLLEIAENNIHEASIFTIHKFFQNLIYQNKFYFNTIFEKKIISDTKSLYLNAITDFWRKFCYTLPKNIIQIIFQYWKEPKALLLVILPLLQKTIKIKHLNKFSKAKFIHYHNQLILKIKIFKKKWIFKSNAIKKILNTFHLNKKQNKQIFIWQKKINLWTHSDTTNYFIPKEIFHLNQILLSDKLKYKKKHQDLCSFINYILKFLKNDFSIKELFIYTALNQTVKIIKQKKIKFNQLEFNDLTSIISVNLNKNNQYLSKLIRKNFPVLLIDEFQDTDVQQYNIFNKVYWKQDKLALILIADPKQSIYNFRGANIQSYLNLKNKIKSYYYLDTNWRSSPTMVNSINTLFSAKKNLFLIKKINFVKITPAHTDTNMYFEINGIKQSGLNIFVKSFNSTCYTYEYLQWASKQCAANISYLLTLAQNNKAMLCLNNSIRTIQAKDITILVRNRNEANIIKKTLNLYNIPSFYKSPESNIYNTKEAIEILQILQAIIQPNNKKKLILALLTNILSTSIYDLDQIQTNHLVWSIFVKKFVHYLNIWESKGIYYLIKKIVLTNINCIITKEINKYHIKLNKILQIAEILQKNSELLSNKNNLLSWFNKKIYLNSFDNQKTKVQKFHNSYNIHITTIHKSKGSEYPIVWIPFAANFSQKKTHSFYAHNNINLSKYLVTNNSDNNCNKLYTFEKNMELLEEIRLSYVALTRSILQCNISVAPLIKGKQTNRNKSYTNLHKSGFGYILQKGEKISTQKFKENLYSLQKTPHIQLISQDTIYKKYSPILNKHQKINIPTINRHIQDNWTVNSFSKLKNIYKTTLNQNTRSCYIDTKNKTNIHNQSILLTHSFPKGKKFGKMLHNILKNHSFSKPINSLLISNELNKNDLPINWTLSIKQWIQNIINTPLNTDNLILSQLRSQEYIKEFEFNLSIKNSINSKDINNLLKLFSKISQMAPKLNFSSTKGILKGFIDLVFFWKGQYYFVDYKSNWLGKNNGSYSKNKIYKTMIHHRYDLQYQLYSVALHRYLKKRIFNYSLNIHFGGIFYLFLRALNKENQCNGIFFTQPSYQLIHKLDTLF